MSRPSNWLKLDNAGKIFPATSGRYDTGVFRFSCELNESVDVVPLQASLEKTLEIFPHFRYILREGLFWFYLEPSEFEAVCSEEDKGVCAQLFFRNKRSLLFRVSYFRNRINLEVFHVLADGTGVMQFFQYFLGCYLRIVHPEDISEKVLEKLLPPPASEHTEDSFKRYYRHIRTEKNPKLKNVYHITGMSSDGFSVIEGQMSCAAVLDAAKRYGSTLTIFLTAVLIMSIHKDMILYNEKRPIVITVPVNLRKYFPSETGRNFFGNIRVAYKFSGEGDTLEDIINSLKQSFESELTKDKLEAVINKFVAVEKNPFIKIIPLSVKNVFLRIARWTSNLGGTMVISNLGRSGVPNEMLKFVQSISIFSSTSKLQACVCSCGDTLSVGFTSRYEESDIQRNFFRMLSEMGIDVCIKSNSR